MAAQSELTYVGFLANVDSTILAVEFSPGTRTRRVELADAVQLLMELDGTSDPRAESSDLWVHGCVPDPGSPVYVVERSMGMYSQEEPPTVPPTGGSRVDDSLLVLSDKIRLARLFHEGNILQPIWYEYHQQGGRRTWAVKSRGGIAVQRHPFHLGEGEAQRLNEQLRSTTLPLKRPYVDLSFRAFEASFAALGVGLPFLAVFSGLEALLNPSDREIRYRLSRNVAALTSRNRDEFKSTYDRLKKLYDKRSSFIHGGEERVISRDDLHDLRETLRTCILAVMELDVDKDRLMQSLVDVGFPLTLERA